MKTVGLVVNLTKKGVRDLVEQIVIWLKTHECEPVLIYEDVKNLEIEPGIDCLLVLGGDGTLLSCARCAAPAGIPLLGVNIGHLGFLTEVDMPELLSALEKIIKGDYFIEERMMLDARVYRQGKCVDRAIALNDSVITKGAFARLIFLETYVNDEYVTTYPADGLIIASPTGSTAYSLSAGGPLVIPEMEIILVTPICPHTLWTRPLVIGADSQVRVNVLSQREEVMLTMDGQQGFKLEQSDTVVVTRSPLRAKFIRLIRRSFFYLLRQKLSEGERV